MVILGLDGIEHFDGAFGVEFSGMNDLERTEMYSLLSDSGFTFVPTLTFLDFFDISSGSSDSSSFMRKSIGNLPDEISVNADYLNYWSTFTKFLNPNMPTSDYFSREVEVLKNLSSNNVWVLAGTDTPIPGTYPGYSLHKELSTFVNSLGMSEFDAIRAATILSALNTGLDHEFGSVEEGKIADFNVLNSNPLQNISNLQDLFMTVQNGKTRKSSR